MFVFKHSFGLNFSSGCGKDEGVITRYKAQCLAAMKQRTPIGCFRGDTDEIVGANMVLVYRREDQMDKQMLDFVIYKKFQKLKKKITKDFNIFLGKSGT